MLAMKTACSTESEIHCCLLIDNHALIFLMLKFRCLSSIMRSIACVSIGREWSTTSIIKRGRAVNHGWGQIHLKWT